MATITKELQESVKKNPRIKYVFFAENGDYFFTKNKITVHTYNDRNESIGKMEVETLPKTMQSVLKVKMGNELRDRKVFIDYTPIHTTYTREEILGMTPASEKKSKEEEDKILSDAMLILKDREAHKLLELELNKKKEQ